MISGEDMLVAIKGKAGITKKWTVPGLLLGNQYPKLADAQGSIARRLVLFHFPFSVREQDTNPGLMKDILDEELALVLLKANSAYLQKVEEGRNEDGTTKSIWAMLPPYFASQRVNMQKRIDPLVSLLESGKFQYSNGDQYSFEEFEYQWKERHRVMRPRDAIGTLSSDIYGYQFDLRGYVVTNEPSDGVDSKGEKKHTHWIMNMRERPRSAGG